MDKTTTKERFWNNVRVSRKSDCWKWTGTVSNDGYAILSISGKNTYAHQISFFYHYGRNCQHKIKRVCHNRVCVNPEHFLVMDLENRFKEKISLNLDSGCWEWTASLRDNRYGQFEGEYAHRFSYKYHSGNDIPKNKFVCHTCDNKKCVNPRHLYVGNHAQNMLDASKRGLMKGGVCKGELHGGSVTTRDDVLEIRDRYKNKTNTQKELSEMFDVSRPTISSIITRKTWKHL